jgi:Amt family ammonium transporter
MNDKLDFEAVASERGLGGVREPAAAAVSIAGSELRTRAILSSIAEAVITTDVHGCIDYMNPVSEELTGWRFEKARGRRLEEVFNIVDEHTRTPIIDPVHRCLKDGEVVLGDEHELVLLHRDGIGIAVEESLAPIRDENGEVQGVVVICRDVSHSRRLAAQINWQATHDALTGLQNRTAFDHQLNSLLHSARHEQQQHYLMYLDLDQFKIINDTCGHVAGDELLRQVASLLSSYVRESDTLARLGGDEFGVLLESCPDEAAQRVANQVRQAVNEYRFGWGERSFSIGVSIGLVAITAESESMERVLSSADTACYAAKDGGRNQIHLFQQDEGVAAERRGEMEWVSRIQKALDDDRFILYAQPIVPILEGSKGGHHEILIRMLDESGSLVPPGAFIPAAERFNLMPAIDRWVVRKVFELIRRFPARFLEERFNFAINLSGGSISDEQTLEFIGLELERLQIPEGMICFEITETAAIANLSSANYFIRTLKQSGCRFSLDDFGSGLSSFAYLKNLPVDYLKIDGAFVKDLADDPIDHEMVRAINQIGHVMDLETIAEFVENDAILDRLRDIGVDYAQGFGVARPSPLVDGKGMLLQDGFCP